MKVLYTQKLTNIYEYAENENRVEMWSGKVIF